MRGERNSNGVVMLVDELTAMARRFHALAQTTSDLVTKERLMALADDYLAQADQLKHERTVTQFVYPISVNRNDRMNG